MDATLYTESIQKRKAETTERALNSKGPQGSFPLTFHGPKQGRFHPEAPEPGASSPAGGVAGHH